MARDEQLQLLAEAAAQARLAHQNMGGGRSFVAPMEDALAGLGRTISGWGEPMRAAAAAEQAIPPWERYAGHPHIRSFLQLPDSPEAYARQQEIDNSRGPEAMTWGPFGAMGYALAHSRAAQNKGTNPALLTALLGADLAPLAATKESLTLGVNPLNASRFKEGTLRGVEPVQPGLIQPAGAGRASAIETPAASITPEARPGGRMYDPSFANGMDPFAEPPPELFQKEVAMPNRRFMGMTLDPTRSVLPQVFEQNPALGPALLGGAAAAGSAMLGGDPGAGASLGMILPLAERGPLNRLSEVPQNELFTDIKITPSEVMAELEPMFKLAQQRPELWKVIENVVLNQLPDAWLRNNQPVTLSPISSQRVNELVDKSHKHYAGEQDKDWYQADLTPFQNFRDYYSTQLGNRRMWNPTDQELAMFMPNAWGAWSFNSKPQPNGRAANMALLEAMKDPNTNFSNVTGMGVHRRAMLNAQGGRGLPQDMKPASFTDAFTFPGIRQGQRFMPVTDKVMWPLYGLRQTTAQDWLYSWLLGRRMAAELGVDPVKAQGLLWPEYRHEQALMYGKKSAGTALPFDDLAKMGLTGPEFPPVGGFSGKGAKAALEQQIEFNKRIANAPRPTKP